MDGVLTIMDKLECSTVKRKKMRRLIRLQILGWVERRMGIRKSSRILFGNLNSSFLVMK